jgi:hypothetical protein
MRSRLAAMIQLELSPVTIAAASAVMGSIAIGYLMQDLGVGVVAVGACTAALSYAATRAATSLARARTQAVLLCLGFTVAAAVLNSPISFVVVGLFDDHYRTPGLADLFGGALLALVVGLCLTIPLGVAFSLPFMVLVGATHRSSRDSSPEGVDRTLRTCGIWLTVVGAGCAAAASGLSSTLGSGPGVSQGLVYASVGLATLGAIAAVVAHGLIAARRAWVARVRAGLVPGWALVSADEVMAELEHLPTLLASSTAPRDVLVRRGPGAGPGAYRRGEGLDPVALV